MISLTDRIKKHKAGEGGGIYSVCSANKLVLKAAMLHAKQNNEQLLIESTSNQVNQDGGYTSMTPADFREYVHELAHETEFPLQQLIFGGDHLGPNCWQHLSAEEAMAKSDVLIAEYVKAGYSKIHLDCSMSCADDPVPLSDHQVATRAARLCKVAEQASIQADLPPPVYVIGTEVPVPGGSNDDEEVLQVTAVDAATQTLVIHKEAFAEAQLTEVWPRIIGLVVQPGVEFGAHSIHHYQADKAQALSKMLDTEADMVFEAHSTDYQSAENLQQLVRDHFAILKVGPWLTFAMREAIFALASIEQVLCGADVCSDIQNILLDSMQKNPGHWQKYYSQQQPQQKIDCLFSLSDRIRYYWLEQPVQRALAILFENLTKQAIPLTLVSQFFPEQFDAVNQGELQPTPEALVIAKVRLVLQKYSLACQ
ncbi:D-tagatose-bisphosphate aldolase, class II, non-catalytic subunit [Neptunicella sp.]|uniref:D-tagatose-bisphosphate aldolase, class II, non-catalytic subunit n=1 Tax=Neptunicella sp. TaxID=2125986 RepID=UPI003F68E43E